MDVYGDLKNGYVEFTLWHERLSDLVMYMRPANYPWQISWKVWNTSEAILLMPTVYGSTSHTSNIVLHLPGAQSTVHARWEFRAHFGGANWEVPYKVYLDTITPQNEIKRNWLYLQDINPHTLIFVPQTQVDVSGWAVAHLGITNPSAYDSDQDYLTDWEECKIYFTNPTNGDSDADGFGNCCECIGFVTDPWSYTQDSDGDGMPDEYESYAESIGGWHRVNIPQRRVALLIVGGYAAYSNYPRYWNDMVYMYDILTKVYNYRKEWIYVLYADGNPPNPQNCDGFQYALWIDTHRNIISSDAKISSFEEVCNAVKWLLTPEDFLFVWTNNHGSDKNEIGNIEWDEELGTSSKFLVMWWNSRSYPGLRDCYLKDKFFAENISRIAPKNTVIIMKQCYAGGFIDDVAYQFSQKDKNVAICTGTHFSEIDGECDCKTPINTPDPEEGGQNFFGEFTYHIQNAFNKRTPFLRSLFYPKKPWEDGGVLYHDKIVSIADAFNYAWRFDSWRYLGGHHPTEPNVMVFMHPQYDDNLDGITCQECSTNHPILLRSYDEIEEEPETMRGLLPTQGGDGIYGARIFL
ncbi:MAG: hypothetical protein QXD64_08110 [Thermoplasmata archaeon]